MSEDYILPTSLADALQHRLRRQLLIILDERSTPISGADLAGELAALEHGRTTKEVTPSEREQVHLVIHHQHLPKLEAAGVIARSTEDGSIALVEQPAITDTDLLDDIRTAEEIDESLDAVFSALANYRRRNLLSILGHRVSPIGIEALADELAETELAVGERRDRSNAVANLRALLHHVHLPKLIEAGLVEYNEDQGSVSPVTNSHPVSGWIDSLLDVSPPDRPKTGSGPIDVHSVSGS